MDPNKGSDAMIKIYCIEDDESIRELILYALKNSIHTHHHAYI